MCVRSNGGGGIGGGGGGGGCGGGGGGIVYYIDNAASYTAIIYGKSTTFLRAFTCVGSGAMAW